MFLLLHRQTPFTCAVQWKYTPVWSVLKYALPKYNSSPCIFDLMPAVYFQDLYVVFENVPAHCMLLINFYLFISHDLKLVHGYDLKFFTSAT